MPVPSSAVPLPTGAPVGAPVGAPIANGMGVLGVPNQPFFLIFDQRAFGLVELNGEIDGVKLKGSYYLPSEGPRVIEPGTHGFRTRRGNEGETASWVNAQKSGQIKGEVWINYWEPIPAEFVPDGADGKGGYLCRMPVQKPGTESTGFLHYSVWDVPQPVIPGEQIRFQCDRAKMNLWIASLVIRGVIPPVPQALVDRDRKSKAKIVDYVRPLNRPDRLATAEGNASTANKAPILGRKAA